MILKCTHCNHTFTIETENDDQDIHEFMDLVEQLCLGMGFQPDSVKAGFLGKAESFTEEEKK